MFLAFFAVQVLWIWRKAYVRRSSWRQHFVKFWTLFDWFLMLWLLMTCILRGIMLLGPKANIYANMVGDPNAIIPAAMGVSMVAIVLICIRGIKFLRGPAATRGLYHTLGAALSIVAVYLGLLFLVIVGYTVAGLYYFGFVIPQFNTFGNALVSTLFIGLGDWSLYGPLTSVLADGRTCFFGGFWFWTYILLMTFLFLNMFTAIMVHAFGGEHAPRLPVQSRLLPPGNSPHLRGYWLRPWSLRAYNCLTLMEGVPWIERVEVGLRVEQDVHVTVCGTTMTFTLRLCGHWHRKLLERATLLVLLPPDVILTYTDAWTGFLHRVSMKEGEVLRFEESDLTALFDEYNISARQRHFVRSYARRLRSGEPIDEELLLRAALRCGDQSAGCTLEAAHREEGTILGITPNAAGKLDDKGMIVITITGMPDCNTWRTFTGCAVHPTAFKNLVLNLQPDVYTRDVLSYFNPYLIVRSKTLITPEELGALTSRDAAPTARCLVPRSTDFKPPRYYKYLIKRHGLSAKAVRHGAKTVGVLLNDEPQMVP
eukprot:TRINITY_DN1803_c0_g1_i1.p1 TRINITY_DN1803_c0_g1~~TRINITY_DN1803_c0_g1_i1.p1  ORF type:complete len:539 (+),score=179.29 TRINITY_DN1803_c0_g1_i1:114-1730(+)